MGDAAAKGKALPLGILLAAVVAFLGILLTFAAAAQSEGTWGKGFVVSIVAFDRPGYLKQVLKHLGRANGIDKYTVLFFLEPCSGSKRPRDCKEVHKLAWTFSASKKSIVNVNEKQKGCEANIKQAMQVGFQHADFVILLEDDILVAKDSLEWMEWARNSFGNNQSYFDVSGYSDNCHKPKEQLHHNYFYSAAKRKHFTPWMWGIWRDRFEPIQEQYLGWDLQMNAYASAPEGFSTHLTPGAETVDLNQPGLRGDRFEVFPVLSRSNNIGMSGGIHSADYSTNGKSEDQMKAEQYLHFWAENIKNLKQFGGNFTQLTEEDEKALCRAAVKTRFFEAATIVGMCKDHLKLNVQTSYG